MQIAVNEERFHRPTSKPSYLWLWITWQSLKPGESCGACQAYELLLEGSSLEALRAIREPLNEHQEIMAADLAAMLYMHQHGVMVSSVANVDEIHDLKNRLQIAEQNASGRALFWQPLCTGTLVAMKIWDDQRMLLPGMPWSYVDLITLSPESPAVNLSRPTVRALWLDCLKIDILHWIVFCNTAVVVFYFECICHFIHAQPKMWGYG